MQCGERLAQFVVGPLLKGPHPQISVAGRKRVALHRSQLDHIPANRKGTRHFEFLAHNFDGDLGALFPPHQLHRVENRHLLGGTTRLVFAPGLGDFCGADGHDLIPGLEPGPKSRRALNRGNHFNEPALLFTNLDAKSVKFTPGIHLHFVVGILGHKGRVGIEFAEQTPNRALHQVVFIHGRHVVAADQVEDIGKKGEVLVALRGAENSTGTGQHKSTQRRRQAEHEGPERDASR